MWIPKNEADIVSAVTSGSLEENAAFDAKREVPEKNDEIAKDIAAMANDGGVLIYGIAEDTNRRPTMLHPIPLANQPERINAVVRSGITEPPSIVISTIPTANDSSVGYIIVNVPMSPRAPHMVTVRGENRYYGRSATGNVILTEAEIARLYERRKRWELDFSAYFEATIKEIGISPQPNEGYLYVVARPFTQDERFLHKLLHGGETIQSFLVDAISYVTSHPVYYANYSPDFSPSTQVVPRAEGFLLSMGYTKPPSAKGLLDVQINFDGSAYLFCGRATDNETNAYFFFPEIVAGNTLKFLALLGYIYDRAGYVGNLDLAVAVTGLKSSIVFVDRYGRGFATPYDRDDYRRIIRTPVRALTENLYAVGEELLERLFSATSKGHYDPISRFVAMLAASKKD